VKYSLGLVRGECELCERKNFAFDREGIVDTRIFRGSSDLLRCRNRGPLGGTRCAIDIDERWNGNDYALHRYPRVTSGQRTLRLPWLLSRSRVQNRGVITTTKSSGR
ncbi:hypothetical protein V1477_001735, partial [Vespula maculifrons]